MPGADPSAAAIQREAVERLKATLFGEDPYVRRRYIRDFHKEFRTYESPVSWDHLVDAARRSDIVFVGDYHALRSCQHFSSRLLEEMAAGRRRERLVLAMEMVFGRHQRILDRYQAGEIEDAEFLRRIRYQQDWGYPWEGYRDLLETARRLGTKVLAADAEPRGGLSTIRRRDAHAARRIGSLFRGGPHPQVLVVFGESHLARGHLPSQLRRSLAGPAPAASFLVIVQNVESIYWQLAEKGLEETEVVRVEDGKYAVFNASPLAKYEAYRQTLDRWKGDVTEDGQPDLTPTIHHVIDTILEFLGIDPYRHRLEDCGGVADYLVDAYPDILPVEDGDELISVLEDEGVPFDKAVPEARELERKGSRYVPSTNGLFIRSFDLLAGAEESTRFIQRALSRRIGPEGGISGGDGTSGRVIEEALCFLGSKVVDPSRRPAEDAGDPDLPSASGRAAGEDEEASRREGHRLGHRIYEAYHSGTLTRRSLVGLFRRDLGRGDVARRLLAAIHKRLGTPPAT